MLIDNKDALTAVDDCNYKIMSGYEWIRKQEIKKRLKEVPSAEPEIIRCKDCEYFRTPKDENNYCDHDFAGIRHVPFDDDYCSYAERKII